VAVGEARTLLVGQEKQLVPADGDPDDDWDADYADNGEYGPDGWR